MKSALVVENLGKWGNAFATVSNELAQVGNHAKKVT